MKRLTKEQKNDDLIKSLLEGGFDESLIAEWLESGTIELEKSLPPKDEKDDDDEDYDDEKSGGGEDDDDDLDRDLDEDEDDDEDDDKQNLAKSFASSILKSLQFSIGEMQDDMYNVMSDTIEKSLSDFTDKIEKSIEGMKSAIIAFGNTAPSFKSAQLSKAVIEKSMRDSDEPDPDNKTILSVSRNRDMVRDLIAKSIDEEKDAEIQKSLRENTTAYLIDPLYGEIGEAAARYMYDKKNVRLVK